MKLPTLRSLLFAAVPAVLFASTAHAVRQPDYLAERPLETAAGSPARLLVRATATTPQPAALAWRQFVATHGTGAWRAIWDADTAVPRRVFGKGIEAPGALADGAVATASARRLLGEQLALLAPGATVDDFVVSHDVVRGEGRRAMRTVSMAQHWKGLRVVGGGVTFHFKNDRLFVFGSTAAAHIDAVMPATIIADRDAARAATAWIEAAYGATPTITEIGKPVVLPIVLDRGAPQHRVVVPVTADLASPRALWTVYVDAATGAPVARSQRLLFAEGTVRYRVSDRQPAGDRQDYPAAYATHTIAAQAVTASGAGVVTWAGTAAATVTTSVAGTYARVTNEAGAEATTTLNLAPDGSAVWDLSGDEFGDAQLTSYVHATIAKRYAIDTLDPALAWLGQQMIVAVNENDICNAYSNLDDIHFFRAGSSGGFDCENTGRLADVVYHEFGHSLHGQSVVHSGEFDGALSEGAGDYYAATITGDPAMGVGFFSPTEPLRHIDPVGDEAVWPDDQDFDTHVTGLIIAGALWDLRKALVADLGEGPGVALADDIFYAVISRSPDIPSSYAEALAEDDDDGNLDNGTPHKCAIDTAFGAHGLAIGESGTIGGLAPPTQLGYEISLAAPGGGSETCPAASIESGTVRWRLREDTATGGEVALAVDGTGDAAATIPTQDDGVVIQYQVTATLSDGQVKTFPENPADPWYELYAGPVTEIACFDFEADPTAAGWTLGGGFQWAPAVAGSDDPSAAYSGTRLIGTAVGDDYQPGTNATAVSPQIDVGGFEEVRLQYRRWLTVEDAFYDDATIAADGTQVWGNLETPSEDTHHRDREWRFHDVDLSAQAADGTVQLTFGLTSDQGLEFGGWSVDDVCIVARGAAVCGDGFVTAPEQCDDGNTTDGDGCSAACEPETPAECDPAVEDCEPAPGQDGGCCSTGGGDPTGPVALGLLTLGVVLGRRRRKA